MAAPTCSISDYAHLSNFPKPFLVYLCKYTILLQPLDKYWFEYYYMYMFKYF